MPSYDEIAFDYYNKRKKPWKYFVIFYNSLKEEFTLDFNKKKGITMDLGCGTGRHSQILSENSEIYLGTDISLEMIKFAKNNQDNTNMVNQQWINCDIESLPIREESLDSVVSIAVIHHILTKKRRKSINNKISKILKKKGTIIISVWGNRKGKNSRIVKKRFHHEKMNNMKLNIQKKRIINDKNLHLEYSDIFLSWTANSKGNIPSKTNRIYHLYNFNELQSISNQFSILKKSILGNESAGNNYFLYGKKV